MNSIPPEPPYTVFIRLPFPRGDFVDPPPVNWEPSKDEALWSIISKLSKKDIDWNEIAAKFQVTVDFLLQQVAYLTERHASQVRAQMRKVTAVPKVSPVPSPQPQGSEGLFIADPTRHSGSSIRQRAPSSTSVRRDSPLPRHEVSVSPTSMRSSPRPPARTSSTNTTTFNMRNFGSGGKPFGKSSIDAPRRRLTSLPITTNVDDQDERDYEDNQEQDPRSPGPAELSASLSPSSSSSSSSPAQSRIIRRPPRFQGNDGPPFLDDDDDDVEPAFLPYRLQTGGTTSNKHDLGATLRGNLVEQEKRSFKGSDRERFLHSQTSDSSSSSFPASRFAHEKRPSGPLSPRRTMEVAGRSPGKGKGYSRDSDGGTPSMGSSFSDLDDTSVTQSALEEALASKMQDGSTISSLRGTMGTISNALRSRYQMRPSNTR